MANALPDVCVCGCVWKGRNCLIKCENDIIVVFDDSIHFISIFIDLGICLVQYNRMVLQASTSLQVFQRVFSETRDTRYYIKL